MKDVFDDLYEEVVAGEQELPNKKRDQNKMPFSMRLGNTKWKFKEYQENCQWRLREKLLLNKMFENIKGLRQDAFYSLDNSQKVNAEIYVQNGQGIREAKKELLKSVSEGGSVSYKLAKIWPIIKTDIDVLSEFWHDARSSKINNLELKIYIANPEKTAGMKTLNMNSLLTSEGLKELKVLEKKYFSDSPIEQRLKGLEDIVAKNETMYNQIVEKRHQIDPHKVAFQKMNTRLDRQYGDDASRESLADITERSLQSRGQILKLTVNEKRVARERLSR